MKDDDKDLFARLEEAQRHYERSLELASLASAASLRSFPPEPARNILYPLDLSLDKDAINALVE